MHEGWLILRNMELHVRNYGQRFKRRPEVFRVKKYWLFGTVRVYVSCALQLAGQLEKEGNSVRCHSTTRSPIVVSLEREYPLHSRYELKSLYDPDRRTFLYAIEKYDKVFVITDSPEIEEGQRTLINALQNYNDDITVVRWC